MDGHSAATTDAAATASASMAQTQSESQTQAVTLPKTETSPLSLTGIYSQSGFDLLGILSRVYHRPNQRVVLGNVDLSCAFTISNPRLPDSPIVYASESFTALTGYTYSEILGFNCRFLQAPFGPGTLAQGSDRKFTDGNVVHEMRDMLDKQMECQFSLINYKKNGDSFINLITIIPLFAPGTGEIEYFIGFQVDLIEQPRAIMARCQEGNYLVGYRNPDEYVPREIDPAGVIMDGPNGGANLSRNLIPVPDTVSEQLVDSSDLLFILSLRARFLYVSPITCVELLGFPASDLNGSKIQDYIHPADLLIAVREMRSAKAGVVMNFLCRFRKSSGEYLYLDISGHIYEGNNTNKKCFILSGRPIHIPTVPSPPCIPNPRDLWAKLTPQGLILFLSSHNYPVFGLMPQADISMVGQQFHDLIALADRTHFHASLLMAAESQSVVQCVVHVGETLQLMVCWLMPELGVHARHVFLRMNLAMMADADGAGGGERAVGSGYASILNGKIEHLENAAVGGEVPIIGGVSLDSRVVTELFRVSDRTSHATSLNYEINGLKVLNKKLRDEIEGLRNDGVQ